MSEPLLAAEAQTKPTEQYTTTETADSSSPETTEQPGQTDPEAETPEVPPEGAPETYEFKNPEGMPEGVEIDPEIHDAYSEAARELDLPQDKAQGLFAKTMSALHQRATEEQERQSNEWTEASKVDKDFGGSNLAENLGIATKALDQFGSDGLRELLDSPTGLGNHPEVIRFMVKVGKAISEDSFVGQDSGQAVDPSDESAQAAKLYPSSAK